MGAIRLSRRQALRWGAGMLATGAAAAGCGRTPASGGIRPSATNAPITLAFQPIIEGGLASSRAAQEKIIAGFEGQNPGVVVQMSDPAGTTANIASIRAGRGPDVFWDFHYAPYLAAGSLLRLDEYLSRENINPDIWSAAQMATLRTATPAYSGTFALPAFFGTMVYVVNLQDVADKGAQPPPADWTMGDFVTLAQRLSGTDSSGHRHYGASMEWYTNQTNDGEVRWLFGAFGGTYIDGAGTGVQLTLPASVAAGEWLYGELLWPQCGVERSPGGTAQNFVGGSISMGALGNWALKGLVDILPRTLDFDFFPFPIFPTGRTTFGTDDFYAISATTKHPEQAWALLKWLSAETDWQRAQIQLQVLSPALNSLWPQWVEIVQQATPVLKGKAVQWFADAALGAYALTPQYFAAGDAQGQALMGNYMGELHSQRMTVAVGFQEAQNAINPVIAQAVVAAEQRAASTTGNGGNAPFAPPAQAGLGAPASPATGLVQVGGGGYAITGSGAGVTGTADGCVFTCLPWQEPSGTFVCSVEALAGAAGSTPNPLASAGLMVRGDLSDDTMVLAVAVTAGRGVQVAVRQQPRAAASTLGPAAPNAAAGIVGPVALQLPFWLQLRRSGLNWIVLTSPDGSRWTAAGPTQPLAVAGCWVGLFAASHGGTPVTATFRRVSFTAQSAYRVGS